jgi:hypothetical protein
MRVPRLRLTVRRLMGLLVAVALECALLREAILGNLAAVGILLMANALGFGFYGVLIRKGKTRTFLIGFELAGLATVLTYLAIVWTFPSQVGGWLVGVLVGPIEDLCGTQLPYGLMAEYSRGFTYARVLVAGVVLPAVVVAITLP